MKKLEKETVRKALLYGMYDNIKGIDIDRVMAPILSNTAEFKIGQRVEVTIDLKHLFQKEIMGEEVEDEYLFDFNEELRYGSQCALNRFDKLMATPQMKLVKETIKEVKAEILERLAFIIECYEERGEGFSMDDLAHDIDDYCRNEC